ncbi:DUF58 domain-containing protein [Desulfosporosinus lacus]|uniref:Uncharacterized conserved protein, DUF58 family, contains vWF domain n=1 Tax=Desulfosporosinus lacus DSM 15449 TaxID=1121420 RepID=A0A1M5Z7K6_9FIRM|nr:DUF58 domain-containing protein [Desulfosporosinus lacus]SHI20219.1 Uncharacterized conserved protein, DUF58 family, contains vWF domain [Desulfosporosinus lacus DSM 15449]
MEKPLAIPNLTSVFTLLLSRFVLLIIFLYLLKVRNFLPAFLLLIIIIIIEIASLWSKAGLSKLKVETKFKPLQLFPGEETVFSISMENKKWLPGLYNWSQSLTSILQLSPQDPETMGDIQGQVYLGPNAKTIVSHQFAVHRRGYYKIPALRLYSRDVLGLFYRQAYWGGTKSVIVYPRLLALEEIKTHPSDFSGLERDKRPFLFDPIMFVGLREYTPDMPARSIHWKASAKQDRLLARIIESSASLQICIAIDAEDFIQPEPQENLFEEALSVAASLAVWADNSRIPFGLIANMPKKEQPGAVILPVNRDFDQVRLVLESLARAEFAVLGSLEDILKSEAYHLPWGTTLIVIGSSPPKHMPSAISQVIFYSIQ